MKYMFSSLILKIAPGICFSDYSYFTNRCLIYKLSSNFSAEAAQRNFKSKYASRTYKKKNL